MSGPVDVCAPTAQIPDAELAAIGREAGPKIDEVRARSDAWFALSEDQVEHFDALIHHDRLWDLYDRAIKLQATSLEGARTKLMLMRWQIEVEHRNDRGIEIENLSPAERMAWSLCDDLVGPVSEAAA